MARYTDIDLLIEAVEETTWYHISKKGELVTGANSKDDIPLYKHSDIKEVLNNAPTADVDKIKIEVAREIFEEIERLLDNYSTAQCYQGEVERLLDNYSTAQCYQGEVFVQKSFDYELENAIAELKKKYTEEKE